jgi:hypothetical protein
MAGAVVRSGARRTAFRSPPDASAVDAAVLLAGRPQASGPDAASEFQIFRIGDAVARSNIHAAVYGALRLVKDV